MLLNLFITYTTLWLILKTLDLYNVDDKLWIVSQMELIFHTESEMRYIATAFMILVNYSFWNGFII